MKIKLTENQLQRILKEMRFDGKKPIEFSDETVELEQDNLGETNKVNEYFAEVPKDKYNKWDRLERDVDSCIRSIIETHKDNFGYDSYGVIDAIYQIMDGMFQRV